MSNSSCYLKKFPQKLEEKSYLTYDSLEVYPSVSLLGKIAALLKIEILTNNIIILANSATKRQFKTNRI